MPAPPQPPSFTITNGIAACSLAWGASAGATGYRVRRKLNGSAASTLVLIYDGDDLAHVDYAQNLDYTSGSNPQKVFDYELVAYNTDGESSTYLQTITRVLVTDTDVGNLELLHPSYNDGSDKTASYSDTTKSGSGGGSDPDSNEALFYENQRFAAPI